MPAFKRHQISRACPRCRQAKACCVEARPCPRCIRLGFQDECSADDLKAPRAKRSRKEANGQAVRIDLLLDLAAKELDKSNERKLSSAQCNPWPASAQGSAAPGSAAPGQQKSVEQGPSSTRLPPLHHLLQLSHPSHGLMGAQSSVLNDLRTSGETSVLGDKRESADAAASAASVNGGDSIPERGVEALRVSQGHLQQAAVQNSQMAGGDSIPERGFEALRAAQQAAVQTSQIAALTTALQALVGQMSTLQEKQASIEKQIHEMQQQMVELSRGVERTQPLPPGPHTTTQQQGA